MYPSNEDEEGKWEDIPFVHPIFQRLFWNWVILMFDNNLVMSIVRIQNSISKYFSFGNEQVEIWKRVIYVINRKWVTYL